MVASHIPVNARIIGANEHESHYVFDILYNNTTDIQPIVHRGEPSPYEWPSINSHWGVLDTCGFPKDAYYLHQATWKEEPVLHLLPHWNWQGKKGQPIRVMTHTNCDEVELFLNGISYGRKSIDIYTQAEWNVPYSPGLLHANGYRNGEQIKVTSIQTSGEMAAFRIELSKPFLDGDGLDAIALNVFAVDSEGVFVPTADSFVQFSVTGSARILGVGNGNPNCHEPDRAEGRSLFNGCCSSPPPGRSKWTLRLLADKSVELQYIDGISHEAVGRLLKKRIETSSS